MEVALTEEQLELQEMVGSLLPKKLPLTLLKWTEKTMPEKD